MGWQLLLYNIRRIIDALSKEFYVTFAKSVQLSSSSYKYCFIKPTAYYSTMFHLSRELVVIFSDYVDFEPRSLDLFAHVLKDTPSKFRLERGCHVFISNDTKIEVKLRTVLSDNNLNSIIIPFSYYEFSKATILGHDIQQRFNKYLFEVDLFSESQPINDDVFFFGRRDYAQDIANKCKNNRHCGVFGLRRSGKTSLLYAVRRLLTEENYRSIYIPCNSELANLKWNQALYRVIKDFQQELGGSFLIHSEKDYTKNENNAAIYFDEDISKYLNQQTKPVTIMFDEIEHITFGSFSASDGWKTGEWYIRFWNAIRGYYLKNPQKLSIIIAGTNPQTNEISSIEIDGVRTDNPMFGQLSESNQGPYLPSFNIQSTITMVNTLGGYMGLEFKDTVCGKLTSDCGGHPFLIRILCKRVNQFIKEHSIKRPTQITEAIYEKVRPEFEKSSEAQGFYTMILLILQENFPKEFGVLKQLATTGDQFVKDTQDTMSLSHLLGYGLIDENNGSYEIKFDTVKRYLRDEYKFEIEGLSAEEKKNEISLRCNRAEESLRKMIRQILQTLLGKNEAKKRVITAMNNNQASQRFTPIAESLDYSEQLFDPSINKGLYLSVLRDIIDSNFDMFKYIFSDVDKRELYHHLTILNEARKAPSHSYEESSQNWTEESFREFRTSMSWLEEYLRDYE